MGQRLSKRTTVLCGATMGALVGALLLAPPSAQAAPPSNDSFANALVLGPAVPAVGTGSNIEATVEANEPVSRGVFQATGTVWWRWTAPASGRFRVDMCDTLPSLSGTLAVFTGSTVGALTNVGAVGTGRTGAAATYQGGECDNGSLQAVAFDAAAGTIYRFAAGGSGNQTSSNIVLRVSRPAVNDNFASAIDLGSVVPVSASGTNVGASVEADEPVSRGVFQATGTVWWRWTAPATARYRVDMCDTLPSLSGTLAVFAGTSVAALTAPTAVGTARTGAPATYQGGDCDNGSLQATAFDAVAGTAYSIAAGGAGGAASSNIVLRISRPAVNDNFANATDLGSTVPVAVTGTNVGASTETNEPLGRGAFSATGTVWWRWTAPASGRFRVDMCDTLPSLSGSLAVYTGSSVGALANAMAVGTARTGAPASYPGGECANQSLQAAAFDAVAGASYSIAVGGAGGSSSSNLVLRVTQPGAVVPAIPANPTTPTTPAPSQACITATTNAEAAAAAKTLAKKAAKKAATKAKVAKKKAKKKPTAKNKRAARKLSKRAAKKAAKAKAATRANAKAQSAQAAAC